MIPMNENELKNVCGGEFVEAVMAYLSSRAVIFAEFIAVCAIAQLTPGSKKSKSHKNRRKTL